MFGNDSLERSARDLQKSIERAKKERGAHVTIYGGVYGDFSKTLLDENVKKDIEAMAEIELVNDDINLSENKAQLLAQTG